MRRGLTLAVALAVVLVGGGLLLTSRGGDDATSSDNGTGLGDQTVSVGDIDIDIQPRQLDDGGAAFGLILDTHSVELAMDLTVATLEVDGTVWPVVGWSGDGPRGHHREGELRFESAGPATGIVRLALGGFDDPVEVSWDRGA